MTTSAPVGTYCALELLRLGVRPREVVATLTRELGVTRSEARAAVRAAREPADGPWSQVPGRLAAHR